MTVVPLTTSPNHEPALEVHTRAGQRSWHRKKFRRKADKKIKKKTRQKNCTKKSEKEMTFEHSALLCVPRPNVELQTLHPRKINKKG